MRISDWSSDVCSSDLRLRCREGDVEVHAGQAPQPESADPAAMVAGELEPQGVAVELQIQHPGRQGTGKANEDGDDVDALVADHHGGAFGYRLCSHQIGRAHVGTAVTNAQPVCRLMLENK